MDPPAPLTVVRGHRGRAAATGTLEELVALARRGELRARDRVAGWSPHGAVALHAIPALARLVPTPAEHVAARTLRTLVTFDLLVGALLLYSAFAASRSGHLRDPWFVVVLFAAMFGAPVVPLWRSLRRQRALREAGIVGGPVPPEPRDDRALRERLARGAPATAALVASLVIAFVLSQLAPRGWMRLLVKDGAALAAGELWRVVTPMFLHVGVLHLLLNATAILELGRAVENLLGRRRFLAVYFAGGMVGFLASAIATPATSVGASGAIFGLIGVLFVFGLRHHAVLPRAARRRFTAGIGACLALNVALGLSATFIDNAAHLGGLAAGMGLGLVLRVQPDVAALLRVRPAAPDAARADVGS